MPTSALTMTTNIGSCTREPQKRCEEHSSKPTARNVISTVAPSQPGVDVNPSTEELTF
jgi:hypothetical protein